MDPSHWQKWLMSPRRNGWPTSVGELLPAGLASFCMAIDNDPGARHPLDATGFLCRERFERLTLALSAAGSGDWMVGYWDGWSGIEPTLREAYGDRLFRLRLPQRDYLSVQTSLDELTSIHGGQRAFVGPSLMARTDRAVLTVGDVDWVVTYVGFSDAELRAGVARALENDGVSVDMSCNPLAPLAGYESTAKPGQWFADPA